MKAQWGKSRLCPTLLIVSEIPLRISIGGEGGGGVGRVSKVNSYGKFNVGL
jgi:hypothetical protein